MGRITSTNVLFLELCLNYVQVLKMCGKAIDIHQCNAQAQRTRVCAKTTCYTSGFVFEWDTWCSLITLALPRGCCRNSAAKLAASWARFTKLAASMVQICQTCSKYGNPSHTWRISGSPRQYDHARKVFSLYCWIVEIAYQRLSANPQAGILL